MSISNGNSTKPGTKPITKPITDPAIDPVIPNELITDFAKTTNDNNTKNTNDGTVCGTIVEHNGKMYVKIDGSDSLTPIITTTDIMNNDRVIVRIRDHIATVTGNMSSPSVTNSTVVDKVEHAVEDTVYNSDLLLNASGGVNVIPNSTASLNIDGWESASESFIVRYAIFESSIGPVGSTESTGSTGNDDVRTPEIHMIEAYDGGLAMLLIDCNNKVIFIDGGYSSNGSHCIQYLKSLGVNKIDYYIVTHCHTDHAECAPLIFNEFPVVNAIIKPLDKSKLPAVEFEWLTNIVYDNFMNECKNRGVNVIDPCISPYIKLSSSSKLQIYNTSNNNWDNYNHQSLMLLYTYNNSKVFLAGDGTNNSDISVLGSIGKVDLLQLAHHGDGTEGGTSRRLIDELKPTHAYFASSWLAIEGEQTMETETLKRVSFHGAYSYTHGPGQNGDFVFIIGPNEVGTTARHTFATNMWYEREPDIWYWFKADGYLAKSETLLINGVKYEFDDNGVCINPWG